ncbi:MAG: beta-lactamase family protein [Desulfovibrio sp.]|nr:beta-lactamase family protein [Desulfovibrio sp.]MBI4958077.1 beta-lactamase family protein [Desulfovibrio sp.]
MNLLALVLMLLLAPVASFAASPDAATLLKKQLPPLIKKQMALNMVKGLSIAVVSDQRVVWSQGFGFADEAAKIPATPDTVYRVGSISKVVTSMRVLQLADAGLVDIDADVRRYVPEFSIHNRFALSPVITPRMLMSHHSGLPTDVVAGMWSENPASLAEYVPAMARESMASPPATQWRYSNMAFSLLGRMIEKVDGVAFNDSMRRGLLQPLGMTDSSYVMTNDLLPRYAKGYRGGSEAPRPTLRDQPTGSLFSTVTDLGRLMSSVFADGRGIISRDALTEMRRAQYPGLPLDFGHVMGLGWMLSGMTMADGRSLAWHGGAAIPFQAFLAIDPEAKLGVVILTNSEEASRFISTVAAKALEISLEAQTGRRPPLPARSKKPVPVALPRDELVRYIGDYATFGAQLGSVWLDGGELKIWLWDRKVDLVPIARSRFLPKQEVFFGLATRAMPDLSFEFVAAEGREALVLHGHAMPYPFERIVHRPVPEAWEGRIGKYATDQPGEGICYKGLELTKKDGLLVAKIAVSSGVAGTPTAQAEFPLVPVSDHEAVIGGIGTGTGAVVRAEGGGLYHSGYDFRRIQ